MSGDRLNIQLIHEDEKYILKAMMNDYFYEMEPDNFPRQYPYLDSYWEEKDRIPIKVLWDGDWIGFVLINAWHIDTDFQAERSIAEFYIVPPMRRRGIGQTLARAIFSVYQGKWEIRQNQKNTSAIAFWRNTIAIFKGDDYLEKSLEWEGQSYIIQLFQS
ncbi:MAG: GNAT family N-acetyltransferase [Bacteroidia bacterium]|nr:GNAT family N-acetyltransferase [Bacteroidia bacterium]